MKKSTTLRIILPLIFFTIFTPFLHAQYRVWTNSKGSKLTAEVISATDEEVTLKVRGKSKNYTLKLATLSKADQEFTKGWIKENAELLVKKAEELEKKKNEVMMIGGTRLVPGKHHQLTIKIDKEKYPDMKTFNKDSYSIGIAVPEGFDPLNKIYTIVHVTVAGKGQPSKALGQYMSLVKQANCVLIACDNVAYGSNLPTIVTYLEMDSKWSAKAKKWPMAFYGFSGGAKASAYSMAQAASWDRNIIGAYMTGCNEDRTTSAIDQYKLKSKQKKAYKLAGIWLSSGTDDKIATPAHHKSVEKSMSSNRMKYVKINSFKGGHMIYKGDQVEALNWMKGLKR